MDDAAAGFVAPNVKRPSLSLSPAAFATSPNDSPMPSPGGGRSPALVPLQSPALIPISSPALRAHQLSSGTLTPSKESPSSSEASSPMPLTPASAAISAGVVGVTVGAGLGTGRMFWANATTQPGAQGQMRSPIPWSLGGLPPAAPHLSEEKDSFSPLPRTPDVLASPSIALGPHPQLHGQVPSPGSFFAKMQDKYLSSIGGADAAVSEPPAAPAPLEFGSWGGRRPSAVLGMAGGLGFRRGSEHQFNATTTPSPLGNGARRGSLAPIEHYTFGGASGTPNLKSTPATGASSTPSLGGFPAGRRPSVSPEGGWTRRPSLLATEPMGFGSFGGWEKDAAQEDKVEEVPEPQPTPTEEKGNGLLLEGMVPAPAPVPVASMDVETETAPSVPFVVTPPQDSMDVLPESVPAVDVSQAFERLDV